MQNFARRRRVEQNDEYLLQRRRMQRRITEIERQSVHPALRRDQLTGDPAP